MKIHPDTINNVLFLSCGSLINRSSSHLNPTSTPQQIAFAACYMYSRTLPDFRGISRVDFQSPEHIGDLVSFDAHVVNTEATGLVG